MYKSHNTSIETSLESFTVDSIAHAAILPKPASPPASGGNKILGKRIHTKMGIVPDGFSPLLIAGGFASSITRPRSATPYSEPRMFSGIHLAQLIRPYNRAQLQPFHELYRYDTNHYSSLSVILQESHSPTARS